MRADDSALILSLYRSAQDADAAGWAGFLGTLVPRTGAKTAHLVLHAEGQDPQIFGKGSPVLPTETALRMRYLRPYSGDDFAGLPPFRAVRTRVEGGGDAWLILSREGADFAAATSVLLDSLAPHVALAGAQFWRYQRRLATQAAAQDMGARLGLAWVLLGENTEPILASEGTAPTPISGGRLRLPAPILRQISGQVRGYVSGQTSAPLAIRLDTAQGLLVPFSHPSAAAILYVQSAKSTPMNPAQMLADLFNLTPAEARFAAELAAGKTIAQAGESVNFTLETARYYSKQIYAKLGASGQSEMSRLIENSVYRLL